MRSGTQRYPHRYGPVYDGQVVRGGRTRTTPGRSTQRRCPDQLALPGLVCSRASAVVPDDGADNLLLDVYLGQEVSWTLFKGGMTRLLSAWCYPWRVSCWQLDGTDSTSSF